MCLMTVVMMPFKVLFRAVRDATCGQVPKFEESAFQFVLGTVAMLGMKENVVEARVPGEKDCM